MSEARDRIAVKAQITDRNGQSEDGEKGLVATVVYWPDLKSTNSTPWDSRISFAICTIASAYRTTLESSRFWASRFLCVFCWCHHNNKDGGNFSILTFLVANEVHLLVEERWAISSRCWYSIWYNPRFYESHQCIPSKRSIGHHQSNNQSNKQSIHFNQSINQSINQSL